MAKTDIHIIPGKDIPEDKWDHFILKSPQGGFYAQHAYLTTLRKDWRAFVIVEKGNWKALMPFFINKRGKYLSLPQPPFTQFLGVMFVPMEGVSLSKKYSSYQRWLELLTEKWEHIHLFVQNFSPAFDFGIPFKWADFELKTRYTYILDLDKSEDELMGGFAKNLQRNIRKREVQGKPSLRSAPNAEGILEILERNKKEGRDLMGGHQASWQLIGQVADFFCRSENAELVEMVDESGKILGANLLGFWKKKAYSLLGVTQPEARKDGSMAFLMWNCILYSKRRGCELYDFEGSMLPGVARFFQEFGSKPTPYLQISRNRLPKLLKWIQELRT